MLFFFGMAYIYTTDDNSVVFIIIIIIIILELQFGGVHIYGYYIFIIIFIYERDGGVAT